jgi:hypothetical protein
MVASKTRAPAPSPRPGKAASSTAKPPRPGAKNHKSQEAQKERDALDKRVLGLLGQKRHAEGLSKAALASALGVDATAVKASLNRLVKKDAVTTDGATMNTIYKAPTLERRVRVAKSTPAPEAP